MPTLDLYRRLRRALGLRPRAGDPLTIVSQGLGALVVVFDGYLEDAKALPDHGTFLRFKLQDWDNAVDLANIHVEDRLRGRGVAERLVRTVADAHPGMRLAFSSTNGYSRRLARKLATRIPHFDEQPEDQARHYDQDVAEGFYASSPPPVNDYLDRVWEELRRAVSDWNTPPDTDHQE